VKRSTKILTRTQLFFLLVLSGGGFTQKELDAFRPIIYNNLISQMKVLLTAAERMGIPIRQENWVSFFVLAPRLLTS
jgi:hypothetical protein